MSIFERDGGAFLPTDAARGPWNPNFLHGGPVAILAGHAIEALPADQPMRVARLTLELLRPVPMASLTVQAELTRPGRKVRLARVVDHQLDVDLDAATVAELGDPAQEAGSEVGAGHVLGLT